jgi:hypothetical protein
MAMTVVDVSGLVWHGHRTTCPGCGRATSLLWVVAGGRLACRSCAARP